MKSILEVSAIENGTVIDHIPADRLFDVMHLLGLEKISNRITFGTNLESKRIGTKAIIKVVDLHISSEIISKIVVFAPNARISYIDNSEVIDKVKVAVPDTITGNVMCSNPMCITNHQPIQTKFEVVNKEKLSIKCHYCEKVTYKEQFKISKW